MGIYLCEKARRQPFQGRLARALSSLESADIIDTISVVAFSILDGLGWSRPYDGHLLVVPVNPLSS